MLTHSLDFLSWTKNHKARRIDKAPMIFTYEPGYVKQEQNSKSIDSD